MQTNYLTNLMNVTRNNLELAFAGNYIDDDGNKHGIPGYLEDAAFEDVEFICNSDFEINDVRVYFGTTPFIVLDTEKQKLIGSSANEEHEMRITPDICRTVDDYYRKKYSRKGDM